MYSSIETYTEMKKYNNNKMRFLNIAVTKEYRCQF
jgi:hypothetical protein